MAGHEVKMGGDRSGLKFLTSKPTGKRPLGRLRRRWRTLLEQILKKLVSIRGIGLIRFWIGIIGEAYECGI